MANIQYCTCRINLAGQNCHIVVYDEFNPVTWPELQVLMALHGDENVMDIVPVKIGDAYPAREKERLAAAYGPRIVEQCFPGRSFRMDLMMTGDTSLPRINGDDEEDDGGEDTKTLAAAGASFKPGRHRPPAVPKEE